MNHHLVAKEIEIHLSTPGYVGKERGSVHDLDNRGVRDTCRSYVNYVSPRPVSFIFNGVEFHFRSSKLSDLESKNIARQIVDDLTPKKKKILSSKD